MIDEYKPNSNKSKHENVDEKIGEPKLEKVVTGKVITKKKGFFQKLSDEFISDDASSIKSYVFGDVLIPAIKKAISDIVTNGIDMILYGGNGTGKKYTSDRISYRNYTSYSGSSTVRRDHDRVVGYSYDDIILDSRGEAEEVIARMDELIESYGLVRVADLYDLVGITGNFTDNKYGWTNIRNAQIIRVRDGYMIKMPRAIPID